MKKILLFLFLILFVNIAYAGTIATFCPQINITKTKAEVYLDINYTCTNSTHILFTVWTNNYLAYASELSTFSRDVKQVPITLMKGSDISLSDTKLDIRAYSQFSVEYDNNFSLKVGWDSIEIEGTGRSTATQESAQEHFVILPNQHYVVTWLDSDLDLYRSYSSDFGLTWTSNEINFQTNDDNGVVGHDNSSYSIFTEWNNNVYVYEYSSAHSQITNYLIIDDSDAIDDPSCTRNSNGTLYCCAYDDTGDLLLANSSVPNTEIKVSDIGGTFFKCDIAVDENDCVWILGYNNFGTKADDINLWSECHNGYGDANNISITTITGYTDSSVSLSIEDNDMLIAFTDNFDLQECKAQLTSPTIWTCQEIDSATSYQPETATNGYSRQILYSSANNAGGTSKRQYSLDGINYDQAGSFEGTGGYFSVADSTFPTSNRMSDIMHYIWTENSDVNYEYMGIPYRLNASWGHNDIDAHATSYFSAINTSTENSPYDGLILYLNFDSDETNVKNTFARDSSGLNLDGQYKQHTVSNYTNQLYHQTAYFDGTDDEINIPDSEHFTFSSGFTWCMWLDSNCIDCDKRHQKYDTTTKDGFTLMQDDTGAGNWEANVFVNPSYAIVEGPQPSGAWEHVCMVRLDNGSLLLYVNSVQYDDGTAISGAIDSSAPLRLGVSYTGGNDYAGFMDEVMIFNKSLTTTQIQAIYQNQSTRFSINASLEIVNQNYGTSDRLNITLNGCNESFGTSFFAQVGINTGGGIYDYNGSIGETSNCEVTDLTIAGSAENISVKFTFNTGTYEHFTPMVANFTYTNWTAEAEADVTAPTITSLTNTSTDNQSSDITHTTDESANATYWLYDASERLVGDLIHTVYTNIFNTSKVQNFSGLLNFTTYYLNLTVCDSSGNCAMNNTFNFTTSQNVGVDECAYSSGDFTPPCSCNFATDIDLGGNSMYVTSAGTITGIKHITNFQDIVIYDECFVHWD